jgi:hypothetical protein
LSFFESKRPIHEQIGGSQQLAALPKQILAFDRQLQTAANELKEWHAEFLFQCVYLTRCGRLAEMQLCRCTTKTPSIGCGDERAQGAKVHCVRSDFCMRYLSINALDTW